MCLRCGLALPSSDMGSNRSRTAPQFHWSFRWRCRRVTWGRGGGSACPWAAPTWNEESAKVRATARQDAVAAPHHVRQVFCETNSAPRVLLLHRGSFGLPCRRFYSELGASASGYRKVAGTGRITPTGLDLTEALRFEQMDPVAQTCQVCRGQKRPAVCSAGGHA